ncbi:hypothetical protein GPZ77_34405 (plasmid) [Streptomyces sp. QHH-9511]|uniref:hypothetical protein n=1 Tax=Streptomyces sp. QHH-9511 TaxID=2684468 RepID=UPI00131770D7|nr:hypothetical protein [Streptomyces sp. QHH-9511]QGZ53324.1 hypothetical protein GPZ77_34405 [Streptomyces sp. QHH-9511]
MSRAQYGDTAAPGRFPLRPGKPLVHRRRNGAWGFTCQCVGHHRRTVQYTARHNTEGWAQAFREAVDHVTHEHKTPTQYETEALEALYALPAADNLRRAGDDS